MCRGRAWTWPHIRLQPPALWFPAFSWRSREEEVPAAAHFSVCKSPAELGAHYTFHPHLPSPTPLGQKQAPDSRDASGRISGPGSLVPSVRPWT